MKRRPGFTLLELLTVIAILTLLIGILIPSLSSARRQAKASACLSNLKGLGTGFAIYLTENKDKFPPHRLSYAPPSLAETDSNQKYVNEYNVERPRWQWFLELEGGPVIDPRPFKRLGIPWDDSGSTREGALKDEAVIANKAFLCPSLDDPEFERSTRNGAYGYNYQYLGNARQDADKKRWDNFAVGMHQIPAASGTVLIADSRGGGKKHGIHSYTLDPPRRAVEKNAMTFGPTPSDLAQVGITDPNLSFSPMEERHNTTGNVIFVDTHGEAMTLRQLGYEMTDDGNLARPINAPNEGDEWDNSKWTGLGKDPKIGERKGQP